MRGSFSKLNKHPVARYAILGGTLFLFVLVILVFGRNYSYLAVLDSQLDNDPERVYAELSEYGNNYASETELDHIHFRLLLYKAKLKNSIDVPSDTVQNLVCSVSGVDDSVLPANFLLLLGDIFYLRNDYEKAASYYQKSCSMDKSKIAIERKNRILERHIYLFLIIVIGITFIGFSILSRKKESELLRERRKQMFLRKKYESSKQYISDNLVIIESLGNELNVISDELVQKTKDYMQLQKESLEIRNKEQEIKKSRISSSLLLIKQSECVQKFDKASRDKRFTITRNDWEKLAALILKEFPQLMNKLDQNFTINLTEKKICLLMLLDMGTLEIANVTNLKVSSISSAKRVLYEKLTGIKGSAKDLSKEIISTIAYPL